mgnify:CR=1 FL=1
MIAASGSIKGVAGDDWFQLPLDDKKKKADAVLGLHVVAGQIHAERREADALAAQGVTPDELARFLISTLPNKRELLVDELLERKEFTEMWVLKWAELLQIRTNPTNQVSYKNSLLYFNWLKDRIADNVPILREFYDEFLEA